MQVEEEAVTDTFARVQHRIRIDRFTGGVQQGALFDEMPEWPRQPGAGRYRINLRLADPPPHEIDLLLLLFKDLWTGDLALGGEAGIGRGRLRGISGGLEVTGAGAWNWTAPPPALWDTAPFVFADEAARAGLRDRYEGKLWAELQRRVAGG